ncbi:hypothetical protein QFC19_008167 [Naganishia cerealis]|uniref:Uncharacterized protein n=1 Tax=Naganishia cerealis TaxID=610337 RepID=A0ACC2V565_9TREE|nr:hypothetical protein QFC19_008167 [Naganishia cerealis]
MAAQDRLPATPVAVPKRSDKRDPSKGSSKVLKEDTALGKVLHIKNFEHNFNVEAFIGGLTEKLGESESLQSQTGAIEPVTYSKTFSTALDHLLALQKQMSSRTRRLDEEMKIAERDYAGRLRDMQAQPPESVKNPDETETKPQTPLEALFVTRTTREGRTKLAVILRRLSALAKDVVENAAAANNIGNTDSEDKVDPTLKADLEKAERVREEVTRFSEQFEKEILRLFDKSYRKGDIKMMATDKVEVDGYQVDGAPSSTSQGSLPTDLWRILNDPDVPAPDKEPGLDALFDEIRLTVSQEAQIIQAVFPIKEEVMKVFLQRVFAQVIQQHLEHLFSKAAAQGDLALLRMLRLTHVKCAALVEDLKRYSFSNNGQAITTDESEDKQATGSSPLAAMLDLCMEEMFISYSDKAISSGTGPASTAAAWLHKYGGVANTFGGTGTGTHSLAASGRASPVPSGAATPRVEDPSQSDATSTKPKAQENEAALETQMAEKMLKLHAEAIGRVVELSLPGDV